jgi:hypothetical protein
MQTGLMPLGFLILFRTEGFPLKLLNVVLESSTRYIVLLAITGSSVTGTAYGGLLGPSNYDECITESMKGVTSDLAARAIIGSCRERFPDKGKKNPASRPLKGEELSKLAGRAGLAYSNVYEGEIYNGNSNLTISEVTVAIISTENGKEVSRNYVVNLQYGSRIPPLTTGSFFIFIILGDEKSDYSWGLVEAKGY